ncbi:hypothetical protein CXF67_01035 [Psychroflexus sp. MES1-P1E]|nr:hypothetical protein CXF67_01035 [Psychroflexus sp. MES1-P1E]
MENFIQGKNLIANKKIDNKLLVLGLLHRCSAFAKSNLVKISYNYHCSEKLSAKKETVKPLFYT